MGDSACKTQNDNPTTPQHIVIYKAGGIEYDRHFKHPAKQPTDHCVTATINRNENNICPVLCIVLLRVFR